MANLTLSIDDDVLRKARIRALEQGTSVNAVVREFLMVYASTEEQATAAAKLVALADRSDAGEDSGGRSWTREGIYDEAAR